MKSTSNSLTTVAPVAFCPPEQHVCYNGGQCLILNGRDFMCNCQSGFTGLVLIHINDFRLNIYFL